MALELVTGWYWHFPQKLYFRAQFVKFPHGSVALDGIYETYTLLHEY